MNPLEGTSVRRAPWLPGGARAQSALDDERSTLSASPGGDGFIALLKAFRGSGGTAPSDILAPAFTQHPLEGAPTLQAHIDRADLFGFEWRDHLWIPLFQFDVVSFAIKPSVQEVRATLPVSWSGWPVAAWFTRPHELLDDRRPVDVLDHCHADVLRAAETERLRVRSPSARMSKPFSV